MEGLKNSHVYSGLWVRLKTAAGRQFKPAFQQAMLAQGPQRQTVFVLRIVQVVARSGVVRVLAVSADMIA